MAKMTKAEVLAVMDEWAALEEQIERAAARRDKGLAPLLELHNEACRPVLARYDKAVAPLSAKAIVLEAQVIGYLEASGRDQVIESEAATAEQKTATKVGSRIADPEAFWKKFKSLGPRMWNCMKVVLKDAETLVGKEELDKICDQQETTTVTRTLRLV